MPKRLLPLDVIPKKKNDLSEEENEKYKHNWDDIYSDHKPQLIHCETKESKKLSVLTYNVAAHGPLMIADVTNENNQSATGQIYKHYNNNFQKINELNKERQDRIADTIQNQSRNTPVILLQEATEEFIKTLKQKLGEHWNYNYDEEKHIATLWDTKVIDVDNTAIEKDDKEIIYPNETKRISHKHFKYQGESVVITNVHLGHHDKAEDGEKAIKECFVGNNPNQFVIGDFNARIPPIDDDFHHNGTGTAIFDLQKFYDYTDGGFVFKDGKIVQLKTDIINELTGKPENRPEVNLVEALADKNFKPAIFINNHELNGRQKDFEILASNDCTLVLEKNLYNVARISITSANDISKDLTSKFNYVEQLNTEKPYKYYIYPHPSVQNHLHRKPIIMEYVNHLKDKIAAAGFVPENPPNTKDNYVNKMFQRFNTMNEFIKNPNTINDNNLIKQAIKTCEDLKPTWRERSFLQRLTDVISLGIKPLIRHFKSKESHFKQRLQEIKNTDPEVSKDIPNPNESLNKSF